MVQVTDSHRGAIGSQMPPYPGLDALPSLVEVSERLVGSPAFKASRTSP